MLLMELCLQVFEVSKSQLLGEAGFTQHQIAHSLLYGIAARRTQTVSGNHCRNTYLETNGLFLNSSWYSLEGHGAGLQRAARGTLIVEFPEELLSLTLILLKVATQLSRRRTRSRSVTTRLARIAHRELRVNFRK